MSEQDRVERACFAMMLFPERFGLKDDWWLLGPHEDPRLPAVEADPDVEERPHARDLP